MEPSLQQSLFGHYETFDTFKNLYLSKKFPNKIINIHPSLLPKYGGKGMYGLNVHMEVVKNNEKKSGFTIHYVNDHYDKGSIIFQKSVPVDTFNALELSKKILTQEHKYYPLIIKQVLNV